MALTTGPPAHTTDNENVSTIDVVASFQEACAFTLDPFQREAIEHANADRSVLVAAPTSSGKTVVAEFAIHRALQERRGVIYTSPLKALSNQKYGDFCRIWGADAVGLLTGDISINTSAAIRVMTTEVLRNMLLQSPNSVASVQAVILDEFHFLADAERGRVWEEIVILLPRDVQIICLSATMSNAEQMRGWVERVHGDTGLVVTNRRPVPLQTHYFLDGKLYLALDAQGSSVGKIKAGGEALAQRRQPRPGHRPGPRAPGGHAVVTSANVVEALAVRDMLPAIYFVFSRSKVEQEATRCAGALDLIKTDGQRRRIETTIDETIAFMNDEHRALPQVAAMVNVLRRGVAYHHAGLLPGLKVLVETLFADGVIGAVFATETLSLGINMPARTVVVAQLTKYDGAAHRPLAGREYHQLIGRAGRRGMDVLGNAVIVHDPWMTFDEAVAIARRPIESVVSSFQLGYNSLMNLLLTYQDRDVLPWLMQRSFLAYQMESRRERLQQERVNLEGQADGAGPGCLIGGPDTLPEYNRLLAKVETSQARIEELEDELRHTHKRRAASTVADDILRHHIRNAEGGELVFIRDFGWSALLVLPGGPLVVPLDGLTSGARRKRLSLSYDQVEAIRQKGRLDLERLPHLEQRGTDPLPKGERAELDRQLRDRELVDSTQLTASPAEIARHVRIRQLETRLAETRADHATLTSTVNAHRCKVCPRLADHRKLVRRATSNRHLVERVNQEIAHLDAEEAWDLRDVVRETAAMLERRGYLDDGDGTDKAQVLARIVDTNTLVVTELVMNGFLDDLPSDEIAEVLSWFAEPDADGRFQNLKGRLRELWTRVHNVAEAIMDDENRHGLFHSTGPTPSQPGMACAWSKGTSFAQLVDDFEIAEGDAIRFLKKAGDLLRQVRRALEETMLKPELRRSVLEAENMVRRDIVINQELLELSDVIDAADSRLPDDVMSELHDVDREDAAHHLPTRHDHSPDLQPARPLGASEHGPKSA
jgi:ATP-dependent RNA helicase HelY